MMKPAAQRARRRKTATPMMPPTSVLLSPLEEAEVAFVLGIAEADVISFGTAEAGEMLITILVGTVGVLAVTIVAV